VSFAELIDSEFRAVEIQLPDRSKKTLEKFCQQLEHWNQRMNLTGLAGRDLVRRLVVEPVWIGLKLRMTGVLADIGSGNGSPAIPLHVAMGMRRSHLFEARAKRAAFLRDVIATLGLAGVLVHHQRFGDAGPRIEPVDWVTLQGVHLDHALLKSIECISNSTTSVVWITADTLPPIEPSKRIELPLTRTKVLVFGPDLS
jgi:16S rRNA (guanine527-N7)-methyltransferase